MLLIELHTMFGNVELEFIKIGYSLVANDASMFVRHTTDLSVGTKLLLM